MGFFPSTKTLSVMFPATSVTINPQFHVSLFTLHTSVSPASQVQKQNVKRGRREHFLCIRMTASAPGGPVLPWFYIQRNTVWQPKAIKKEFQPLLESLKALSKGPSSNPADAYKAPFLLPLPLPRVWHTPNLCILPLTLSAPSALWPLPLPSPPLSRQFIT